MSLKERLQLEYEILEKIDNSPTTEEVSEEIERAIIERELAELERQAAPEEALVLVRRRRAA